MRDKGEEKKESIDKIYSQDKRKEREEEKERREDGCRPNLNGIVFAMRPKR